ncbi:hypothetical protein PTTG_00157 [Puccinia triticina 1-1 BBBD Race 1]|uniref:Peptide hydrolase n=2 Tax=Puccinia triticina TaxID=208348 RepID=A0A180GYN1_PUCT1|nr:uncharacterized protein PtA15_9A631 [Puccinia triticina]OAV97428.1 hypothetical protein PTTG_00157 [Puccinia triticina 1-1 BBBD Race 1]WAQ88504.1 hypothetical protein PtA15_9A631 [Puccinia triticina]
MTSCPVLSRSTGTGRGNKIRMKTTRLLTIFLLQLISATTPLQLSLQPATSSDHRPCATFLGTTADGNHHLFSSNPADCPHAGKPPAIALSYQPLDDGLLYSLAVDRNDHAGKRLLSNLLASLQHTIHPAAPRNPAPGSPSQWVLEPQQPSGVPAPGVRILLDEPEKSSAVLVEVSLGSVGLFLDLLPAEVASVRHPSSPTDSPAPSPLGLQGSKLDERLTRLHYRPQIDQILGLMSADQLLKDIETLGGEGADGGWRTRHSFSEGALLAAHWLKERYQRLGARCQFDHYLPGVAPNLICKLSTLGPPDPHHLNDNDGGRGIESVVLTAHYDSQGSFGSIRAPGVDDNASGCAVLLSIAEILQEEESKNLIRAMATNESPGVGRRIELVFVHFSGTEQGLLGSRSVAEKFRDEAGPEAGRRRAILLLMNVDMISYRVRGEPAQIGLSTLGPSPESLAFIRRVANLYVPELLVGNSTIGLADEAPFHENGFADAVRIFERIGDAIRNPHHLTSSDRFSRFFDDRPEDDDDDDEGQDGPAGGSYDVLQMTLIAKVVLASVLQLLFP